MRSSPSYGRVGWLLLPFLSQWSTSLKAVIPYGHEFVGDPPRRSSKGKKGLEGDIAPLYTKFARTGVHVKQLLLRISVVEGFFPTVTPRRNYDSSLFSTCSLPV